MCEWRASEWERDCFLLNGVTLPDIVVGSLTARLQGRTVSDAFAVFTGRVTRSNAALPLSPLPSAITIAEARGLWCSRVYSRAAAMCFAACSRMCAPALRGMHLHARSRSRKLLHSRSLTRAAIERPSARKIARRLCQCAPKAPSGAMSASDFVII